MLTIACAIQPFAEAQTRLHPLRRGDAQPCLTIPPVAPGTTTSSRSISNEGVFEQVTEWIEDGPTRTRSIQVMTEPGPYLDVDATLAWEVVPKGGVAFLALRDLDVRSTTRFGMVEVVSDSNSIFTPSMVLRPVALCLGQSWTIDATSVATTTTRDGTTETSFGSTPSHEGHVVDWTQVVIVPAGSFRVVRWDGLGVVNGGIFRTSTWVSLDYGVPVRQLEFGPDGALIQTTEMTALAVPDASPEAPPPTKK